MTIERKQSLVALAIYSLVAIALLAVPAGFGARGTLISAKTTEPTIFLWSLAWWPWAIIHGINPIMTKVIWAPVGWDLLWASSVPSIAIIMSPVTAVFGSLVSYNIVAVTAPAIGDRGLVYLLRP